MFLQFIQRRGLIQVMQRHVEADQVRTTELFYCEILPDPAGEIDRKRSLAAVIATGINGNKLLTPGFSRQPITENAFSLGQ